MASAAADTNAAKMVAKGAKPSGLQATTSAARSTWVSLGSFVQRQRELLEIERVEEVEEAARFKY